MKKWTKEEVYKAMAEREYELAVLMARKKFYEEEDDQFILIGQVIGVKESEIRKLRNILIDIALEEMATKVLPEDFYSVERS